MAQKSKSGGFPTAAATGVIYARYSSHNQREASIEQQVNECQKFAETNNLTITEIYADKAVSGKTDQRLNFQRMMRDAAKKKFQYVVAWKSNRMGRNMLEAMLNDARLRDLGIRCLYTEEDFDDTAAGRFALRNMMNVNQFYSENMAEDVIRGMEDNAQKCLVNGPLCLGFCKGEDGRYAIDEAGAAIVREIYERVVDREPFVDIYNDLNARGLKTSKGSNWNRSSFRQMLSNERYRGVYIWGETRIEGGVPRIISDALYYRVQEVLKMKRNVQGRHRENGDYLLTGKLFCGHCGSAMIGMSGTSQTGDKHHYYICQKRRLEKSCSKKTVRRDFIEQRVAEAIKENMMRRETIDWLVQGYEKFIQSHRKDSLLLSYEEELAGVKKSIANIMRAIEQGIITPSTKERLTELEDERRQLEISISVEKVALEDVPKQQIEFWLQSFMEGNTASKSYQEKVISAFVQAVYLYDGEMKIVCNYTGCNTTTEISFADIDNIDKDSAESRFDYALQKFTMEWHSGFAWVLFCFPEIQRGEVENETESRGGRWGVCSTGSALWGAGLGDFQGLCEPR